ncbi:cytochrome C oxidase subunit IV family protein [Marivita sp. S6314]|uniref:cytochrome C oxidase subunit IV family protein n=1 Tax=Marivita sp. S6314 TaxID=2926406 RepID=UPI001FF1EC19|nr:cytochrome C oxidase subunit IV family protein [Marivita sp. S6314]MCK0150466.1 cytochrome C oxidase subunit IV family protein [Marivita sp. S6314]
MTRASLYRAWIILAVLTAIGTALHFSPLSPVIAGLLILAIAGVKARIVLLDYLELRGVPGWSNGIQAVLFALLALIAVLFAAA